MKVLIVHNFYKIAGGEDSVFYNEIKLLEERNHHVLTYEIDNATIKSMWGKILATISIAFSFSQYKKMRNYLRSYEPDVVHVHNYFPLLSPSIFYACKKEKIPVVHTLHNYRAICPTASFMHDGKVNLSSVKGSSWWTISKKVYRNSTIGSLALALMVELHKRIHTWQQKVDRFIALTEFSKLKYIEAGWPANKIVVKPNFIDDAIETNAHGDKVGGYALYVGRLSKEKGIETLLAAWQNCEYPLKVVGDGPLRKVADESNNPYLQVLGKKNKSEVIELVRNADFLVMPSICYETFGMVIIEAFACFTPVVVSRLGSLQSIVTNEFTGLHFEVGNESDLLEKVQWMVSNPEQVKIMGLNARNEYLSKYKPEENYQILIDVYKQAIIEARNSNG